MSRKLMPYALFFLLLDSLLFDPSTGGYAYFAKLSFLLVAISLISDGLILFFKFYDRM